MSCALTQSRHHQLCEKALTDGACTASVVASYASIEAALEPVKLFESLCEGCCNLGSRFAVQSAYLDQAGAPAAAFRSDRLRLRAVWAWLCGLFRPAASRPATANPRSRMSFMITFGFARTR